MSFAYGGMAEWSIAADCKSAELYSTLVRIQLPPPKFGGILNFNLRPVACATIPSVRNLKSHQILYYPGF